MLMLAVLAGAHLLLTVAAASLLPATAGKLLLVSSYF